MKAYDRADIMAIVATNTALVDMLDGMYPERAPDPGDSERVVWMKAGQRELIRKLQAFRDEALDTETRRHGLPPYRVGDSH